jgi:hypothetical protein
MKVDTDGYDYEVLKGARGVLKESRPLVFAELQEHCLNWHGYGIADVVSYLNGLEYETWMMRRRDPPRFTTYLPSAPYELDCLLVPAERADAYQRYRLT